MHPFRSRLADLQALPLPVRSEAQPRRGKRCLEPRGSRRRSSEEELCGGSALWRIHSEEEGVMRGAATLKRRALEEEVGILCGGGRDFLRRRIFSR